MSSMTNPSTTPLRLAVQTLLLPGDTLDQKFEVAASSGFDAVEVCVGPEFDLAANMRAVQSASENSGLPVAAICTHPIHDPVEGDANEIKGRVNNLVELINLANELGAAGVVSVPVRSRTALNAASTRERAISQMADATVEALTSVAGRLDDGNASLFLEPLNRYEAWFLNTVGQAVELSDRVNHPRVKALADIFHMNIEESSLGEPIRKAGSQLGHVHVADNNRLEPGAGCLPFHDFFRALRDIQYTGYVSIECFSATGPVVSGPPDVALPNSASYMRSVWESLES